MHEVIINSFPNNIIQEEPDWCIPATITAIVKYYDKNINLTQSYIISTISEFYPDGQISFPRIHRRSINIFSTEYNNVDNFNDWLVTIKKDINRGRPIVIATKTKGQSNGHIRTVVGYDNDKLRLFDTQLNLRPSLLPPSFQWDSGFTEYLISDARNDFNQQDSWTDLLIIKPKRLKLRMKFRLSKLVNCLLENF